MEEDVPAATFGTQEAKTFVLEIRDYGTGMFPGSLAAGFGRVALCLASPAGLVSYALLDKSEIVLAPLRSELGILRNFQIRILLAGFFE